MLLDSMDLSKERRSPENFYPSPRPLETNEVNVQVTEQVERVFPNDIPFSPLARGKNAGSFANAVPKDEGLFSGSSENMARLKGARID